MTTAEFLHRVIVGEPALRALFGMPDPATQPVEYAYWAARQLWYPEAA